MNYLIMIIGLLIFPIVINIVLYAKYKLVPAIYMNCWILLVYLSSFIIVTWVVLSKFDFFVNFDKALLVLFGVCLILIPLMLIKIAKSVNKGIKLRLNKKLLITGTKIEINNLKLEIYKTLKNYYLGYYKGTYIDKNGKKHTFISEDYLKNPYSALFNRKIEKNFCHLTMYVNPDDGKKYYYKIEDFR